MATASVTTQPRVVVLGSAREERYAYKDDEAIVPGDLIRITTVGTVKLAKINSASAGAVHGMALETGASGSTDPLPVLLFGDDTVLAIQCIDTVAPEDLTKSIAYTLEKGTGVWGITSTTTNGVATVVDYAATAQPWSVPYGGFDQTASTNNKDVLVRFKQAILDGNQA